MSEYSKFPLEYFEFHPKEILSKDGFIKYLMETQTKIPIVVTSVKTQEKTREKIQKTNINKNNTLYKENIYSNIFCVNTTLVKIIHDLSMNFSTKRQTTKQ